MIATPHWIILIDLFQTFVCPLFHDYWIIFVEYELAGDCGLGMVIVASPFFIL